jgi:hypothetical protein
LCHNNVVLLFVLLRIKTIPSGKVVGIRDWKRRILPVLMVENQNASLKAK